MTQLKSLITVQKLAENLRDVDIGPLSIYLKIITPFKNAAKDSLSIPRQYKQIHFVLGKISLFFRVHL